MPVTGVSSRRFNTGVNSTVASASLASVTGRAPAAATSAVSSASVLTGWSGDDAIPSTVQEIKGTWMVRDSWASMAAGNYLTEGTFGTYVAANPTRVADIGVPLIPHDSTSESGWNALLDSVVAGTHDSDHFAMGAKIAQFGPQTVFARLWWEMNMTITQPDYTKFKNAWNRAVPNIRAGFASAADPGQTMKIVYCYLPDRDNQDDMYPNNSMVDLVGSDIYGKKYQSVTPTSQELLDEVNLQLTALTQFGADRGKSTSLGEWANWQQLPANGVTDSRGRGDFPAYIDAVFDWIVATNPTYCVYFNISDGGVGQRLIDTPNSLARYQTRVAALT